MAAELEEKFKEISQHKNVLGTFIMTTEGAPVRSSMETNATTQYVTMVHRLLTTSRELLQEVDATNDVKFLRFTTKKNEIMISPDPQYTFVVISNLPDEHK